MIHFNFESLWDLKAVRGHEHKHKQYESSVYQTRGVTGVLVGTLLRHLADTWRCGQVGLHDSLAIMLASDLLGSDISITTLEYWMRPFVRTN